LQTQQFSGDSNLRNKSVRITSKIAFGEDRSGNGSKENQKPVPEAIESSKGKELYGKIRRQELEDTREKSGHEQSLSRKDDTLHRKHELSQNAKSTDSSAKLNLQNCMSSV